MNENKLSYAFFFALFFALLYVSFLMFRPFLGPMIFGGILAGTFAGTNLKIKTRFSLSRAMSAFITCMLIFVIVIVPLIYIFYQLSNETITLYGVIKSALNEDEVKNFLFGDSAFATFVKTTMSKFNITISPEEVQAKLLTVSQTAIGMAIKNVNGLLNNLLSFTFNFLIMFAATYGFLAEGHKLKKFMFDLSPLKDSEEELILSKFNQMNYVSIYCNGLGGLIQGVLAGVALGFAGISSVFFWTTLMVLLAFIPLVGISVVIIPASIYLWIKGQIVASIVLFVFCVAVSLWTENVFKPKFIGARVKVDSFVMLLFIMGGMALFGMAGIFYGPIICILLLTIIELYHEKYKNYQNEI
jgi:predicted PurR-regulated permease PerM